MQGCLIPKLTLSAMYNCFLTMPLGKKTESGPTGLPLTNTIWQKREDVITKVRLQRLASASFVLLHPLTGLLLLKPAAIWGAALRSGPWARDWGRTPANSKKLKPSVQQSTENKSCQQPCE